MMDNIQTTISHKRYSCNRQSDLFTYYNRDMRNLGQNVRKARLDLGLNQKQLGKRAQISQTTISDIERGRNASTTELPALAKALGKTMEELTGEKTKTNSIIPVEWTLTGREIEVKSIAQILRGEHGSGQKMTIPNNLPPDLSGFVLNNDQMYGVDGDPIKPGSFLAIDQFQTPEHDDIVVATFNDDPDNIVIGHYRRVAGREKLKPSNSRYELFDITDAKKVGVVRFWYHIKK